METGLRVDENVELVFDIPYVRVHDLHRRLSLGPQVEYPASSLAKSLTAWRICLPREYHAGKQLEIVHGSNLVTSQLVSLGEVPTG